jgi:hypothetical protein
MEQLTAKITNFGCEHCGYYQDFNSLDEPERHARICPNVPAGVCPACHFGHNDDRVVRTTQLSQVVDLSQVSTVTIASDEELESKTEVEVDQSGDVVMEQTGERETLVLSMASQPWSSSRSLSPNNARSPPRNSRTSRPNASNRLTNLNRWR